MKNVFFQKAVFLTFILSISFIIKAKEKPPMLNKDYLSVKESLIPMFARLDFSGLYSDEQFPLYRINPQVKDYIRFYLKEDNADLVFSSKAVWLMGFIGDEDDMSFIEQFLDKILESSKKPEGKIKVTTDIAICAGRFAGMMIKRNINGAESFFKKYAKVSVWIMPSAFSPFISASEDETARNLSNAKNFYSCFIICAYQYSKAPYIAKLLQEKSPDSNPYPHESNVDSYLAIKVDKYTELMKPVSISEKKLNENMEKCLDKYGEWIDMLLKKQTLADWQKAQEEQERTEAAKQVRKPTESLEIVDMNKTIEGANLKAIVTDSVKAYLKLSKTGNAESILIPKEFLQELLKAGLKDFANFNVKAEIETTINNFVPSMSENKGNNEAPISQPNIVWDKVNANIKFDIKGTGEMQKKYGADTIHVSLLSPKTGDFTAVMIRTNNNWTWAPVVNTPVSTDSNIVDDKYLIDSVNKAMIAFNQISQSIIDGNYDPLTIQILDNDKLIPLEKRKKDTNGMTKALDIEKQILGDLKKNNLNNYGDYLLKITYEATLDNGTLNIDTGSMPKDIKGYETADLTFTILNGAEAYKSHTSSRNDQSWADTTGNLKVTMKRINGIWYWNPFGW